MLHSKPECAIMPFPECAKHCGVIEILGVGECESVCPKKFDANGQPIKAEESEVNHV